MRHYIFIFLLLALTGVTTQISASLNIDNFNNFISYTNFNAAFSQDPLKIISYRWNINILDENGSAVRSTNGIGTRASETRIMGKALFYPSPFNINTGTSLGFEINNKEILELRLYDVRGNEIFRKILNCVPGWNSFPFNKTVLGKDMPADVYFFLIILNNKILGKGKFATLP